MFKFYVCVCEVCEFERVVIILIVDSRFWLALLVDVGLRLPNHIKYYCFVWMFYFAVHVDTLPLIPNHSKNDVTLIIIYHLIKLNLKKKKL